MTPEIAVRARIESFRRGEREILSNVEVTIRAGEHWALVGANGSGKTTLLRVLSGYEWPSRGSVEVLGHAFGQVDMRELRKRVGVVSSAIDPRLPGHAPAVDVVLSGIDASFGLWRAFDETERKRAEIALGAIGVLHVAKAKIERLSQGERQRVLIARALVNEPSLLILDEACGGLDPVARQSFLDDLESLAKRAGRMLAILFVSHHVEEIPSFVRNAILLADGYVVAQGAIESVFTDALFTRAFGAPCELKRTPTRYELRVARREPLST